MSNSEQSADRSKSRRRGRRRPRRNRARQASTPEGRAVSKSPAEPQAEESPPKRVFIYTYTIRKSG